MRTLRTPSKEESEKLIANLKKAVDEEGYEPVDDPLEETDTPENIAVFLEKKREK